MVDATRAPSHQQTQPRGDREGSEEPTQAGPPPESQFHSADPGKNAVRRCTDVYEQQTANLTRIQGRSQMLC